MASTCPTSHHGLWGLDNVNIVPGPGGSFTWSPGGQTSQNLTVASVLTTTRDIF